MMSKERNRKQISAPKTNTATLGMIGGLGQLGLVWFGFLLTDTSHGDGIMLYRASMGGLKTTRTLKGEVREVLQEVAASSGCSLLCSRLHSSVTVISLVTYHNTGHRSRRERYKTNQEQNRMLKREGLPRNRFPAPQVRVPNQNIKNLFDKELGPGRVHTAVTWCSAHRWGIGHSMSAMR